MKRIFTFAVMLIMAVSCTSNNNRKAARTEENSNMVCGGYTEQREPNDEELRLFEEVTGTGEMIITPLSVATQVVAGTNYKFLCVYEGNESQPAGQCWVTIYVNLEGEATLTDISLL